MGLFLKRLLILIGATAVLITVPSLILVGYYYIFVNTDKLLFKVLSVLLIDIPIIGFVVLAIISLLFFLIIEPIQLAMSKKKRK